MEQNKQQAYDRGITIFSPDGRLYQVEYAREAVKRGTSSVGVRTDEGVVLAAARRVQSHLVEEESIEKIHTIDEHIAVASAGHVADARKLIEFGRVKAQQDRIEYDQPIEVEELTGILMEEVQEYTQTGGARPFGVALLVAGVYGGRPRLFETDPSGTPREWKATAIGQGTKEARSYLEETWKPGLGLDAGVDLALETLSQTTDDVDAERVDVATIGVDTASVQHVSNDRLESRLAELDLQE